MQEIGTFEAKNKFAEILRRVEAGEIFCITRHGKPIAQISAPHTPPTKQAQEAFSKLRELRNALHLTPDELVSFRSEGRS